MEKTVEENFKNNLIAMIVHLSHAPNDFYITENFKSIEVTNFLGKYKPELLLGDEKDVDKIKHMLTIISGTTMSALGVSQFTFDDVINEEENLYNDSENNRKIRENYHVLYQKILNRIRTHTSLGDEVFYCFDNPNYYNKRWKRIWWDIEQKHLIKIFDHMKKEGLLDVDVTEHKGNMLRFKTSFNYTTNLKTYENVLNTKNVFIACAFNNSNSIGTYTTLKNILINHGYNPVMLSDPDSFKIGNIDMYIKNAIENCEFMIADITPRDEKIINSTAKLHNCNVFYEAGMAIGFGKKVLYISKEGVESSLSTAGNKFIPFDINSHHILFFENENDLEANIKKLIYNNKK